MAVAAIKAFPGADSRAASIAANPTIAAPVQYQAGASGLPVTLISQVTAYCVVPPNVAMANAYTMATPPERIDAGNDSVTQITMGITDKSNKMVRTAVADNK